MTDATLAELAQKATPLEGAAKELHDAVHRTLVMARACSDCYYRRVLARVQAEAEAPPLARVQAAEAALTDAFNAMDAACQWAANETAGVKTVEDADRHMRGYDALLDATVRTGQAAGILRDEIVR